MPPAAQLGGQLENAQRAARVHLQTGQRCALPVTSALGLYSSRQSPQFLLHVRLDDVVGNAPEAFLFGLF
ncbi:hypothetical protein OE165_28715, partial [Escherichia coli]|uniref:hypothetical protein n=1 Tax=Escherichia coli TaxID=562 RepID=UPI0021F29247